MGHKNDGIPLTAAEQAEHDAAQIAAQAHEAAEAVITAQKATDKAAAVSKLEALGLTADEIAALSQ